MHTLKSILFSLILGIFCFASVSAEPPKAVPPAHFRFISLGDAQGIPSRLATTAELAASLEPDFVLFNGDLQDTGTTRAGLDPMIAAFGSLFEKTFLVRGNHDNALLGSSLRWENYLAAFQRPLPPGVTNYVALNPNTTYLSYSFDYGNSRFIGLDVPGDVTAITDKEERFLDERLTDAEAVGLTHAFLFFHGPAYCVEAIHCTCTARDDASCTPSSLVEIFDRHPILAATFHGHEHILGWVHMDGTRLPGLTHPYEEFLTSPAGGYTYNVQVFPQRIDYFYSGVADVRGFAAVEVNGASFTVSLYDVSSAVPVWSMTFWTKALPVQPQYFRFRLPVQYAE